MKGGMGGMDMKGKGGMPAMFPAAAMMFPPWMAKGAGKQSMGPIESGPSMPVVANQANLPHNIFDNVGRGRGKGGFGGKEKGAPAEQKGKSKGKGKKGKRSADANFDTDADLIRAMEDMNLAQEGGAAPY